MTCGLEEEELFILNLFYTKRCFKQSSGYHSEKLAKLFFRKFNKKFKRYIQNLLNKGFITAIGKSPEKYYISKIPDVTVALRTHGYNVVQGKERRL